MKIAALTALALLAWATAESINTTLDRVVDRQFEDSYDPALVKKLDALVGKASKLTRGERQAKGLAEVWNISAADLNSNVNIFGERQ